MTAGFRATRWPMPPSLAAAYRPSGARVAGGGVKTSSAAASNGLGDHSNAFGAVDIPALGHVRPVVSRFHHHER